MSKPTIDDVLGLYDPWTLKDVLIKLMSASTILLIEKDYDGHGWEEINHCIDRGNEIVKTIDEFMK